MDKDIIPNESIDEHETKPQTIMGKQTLPLNQKETLTSLLPKDLPSLIASIGVLAGIVYYAYTQNPWLLLTFLGILFGKSVVDQVHHPR